MVIRSCVCLLLALTLLGCEEARKPSVAPSTSAATTAAPPVIPSASLAPSATPEAATPATAPPAPPNISVGSLARVVSDGLRMRTEPGVNERSTKLEPLLDKGTLAYVLEGPERASGFDWYRIHPTKGTEFRGGPPAIGWVAAAAKDGEPWLRPASIDCPRLPVDAGDLVARQPVVLLTCYGATRHTLDARLGAYETGNCFETNVAWFVSPGFFDPCARTLFLVDPDKPRDYGTPQIEIATAPKIDVQAVYEAAPYPLYKPRLWPRVRVTGSFDHPAATRCRAEANRAPDYAEPEPDPALVVLACRATFVVTSIDILPR